MNESTEHKPHIWCLLDGRPGHRNQVLGLADALCEQVMAEVCHVEIGGVVDGIRTGFSRRHRLPAVNPALLIGAGHSTHVPLLHLGFRLRAQTVVLMMPTFPLRLFDLCLLPDVYSFRTVPSNVILTSGVLNRIRPSQNPDSNRGLFLVGGPCDHHQWSDEEVLRQITSVIEQTSVTRWTVATSRRTPSSFVAAIQALIGAENVCTPMEVSADWLPSELSRSATIWVTEDSVSMMYEAVTSGAATGIIELQRTRHNRATQCVDLLLNSEQVTSWQQWDRTHQLNPPKCTISESERCAGHIAERMLPEWSVANAERSAA